MRKKNCCAQQGFFFHSCTFLSPAVFFPQRGTDFFSRWEKPIGIHPIIFARKKPGAVTGGVIIASIIIIHSFVRSVINKRRRRGARQQRQGAISSRTLVDALGTFVLRAVRLSKGSHLFILCALTFCLGE